MNEAKGIENYGSVYTIPIPTLNRECTQHMDVFGASVSSYRVIKPREKVTICH